MPTQAQVLVQNWQERERGWGTRPDGFTVHVDAWQHALYLEWHYRTFNNADEAPDEYTCAWGEPFWVPVDDATFAMIKQQVEREVEGRPRALAVTGKRNHWQPGTQLTLEDLQLVDHVH